MDDVLNLTFGEDDKKKLMVVISNSNAWIENEKGEKVEFVDAKELSRELYLSIEYLFNSRKRG